MSEKALSRSRGSERSLESDSMSIGCFLGGESLEGSLWKFMQRVRNFALMQEINSALY